MGKSRKSYVISVLYTRPHILSDVKFLEVHHIKSPCTPEELRKVFTVAFREAHPDWPIKQVTVEQE